MEIWKDKAALATALNVGNITNISRVVEICSLWAGYGTVVSFTAHATSGASGPEEERLGQREEDLTLVCKVVNPPAGAGESHARKVKSYQVECEFYGLLSAELLNNNIHVAKAYHMTSDNDSGEAVIIMSDLRTDFPIQLGRVKVSENILDAAVDWLAKFHAWNWEDSYLWDNSVRCTGRISPKLWTEGCYWRLDTRRDEFEAIDPDWYDLKNAAGAIANLLKNGSQSNKKGRASKGVDTDTDTYSIDTYRRNRFRTLVHGDYKAANVALRENENGTFTCAAYDFQYTGGGYGVRDVTKLIVTSADLGEDTLAAGKQAEGTVLKLYHEKLLHYMEEYGRLSPAKISNMRNEYTLEVMQQHYELCLLDYVRFMQGWGLWGNTCYAQQRARELLRAVDGGRPDLSPSDYSKLFAEKYHW